MRFRKSDRETVAPVLPTGVGVPLGGVIDEDTVRERARPMGERSVPDEALWGPNRVLYLAEQLLCAAKTAIEVIGLRLAQATSPIEDRIERRGPYLPAAEQRVDDAAAVRKTARAEADGLRATIRGEGHPVPEPQPWRPLMVALGLLLAMISELYVLGPVFAIMDVVDDRVLPWLPVTFQHVAALGIVIMLWPLTHGDRHPRPTPDGESPDVRTGRVARLLASLREASQGYRMRLAGIAAVLLGLTLVREAYIAVTPGKSAGLATAAGFLLINIGVVIGLRYLGLRDTRPYAAAWASALTDLADAEAAHAAATDDLARLIGDQNADVARLESLDREGGHAARAISHDANRLAFVVVEEVRASLPEPLATPMLPGDVPQLVVADPDTTAPAPVVEPRTTRRYTRYVSRNLGEQPVEPEEPATTKRAAARGFYHAEIGPKDGRNSSELGKLLAQRFGVHDATGRGWIAEFRREDAAASKNGHQNGHRRAS